MIRSRGSEACWYARSFATPSLRAIAALAIPRRAVAERAATGHVHTDPRPGIDASNVLTADEPKDYRNAIPAFDVIRQIPEIADGIRCHCGCAGHPGFYSLLSCYEKGGMATYCSTCHEEGKLVFELHQRGKSLDDLRAAVCAKFD